MDHVRVVSAGLVQSGSGVRPGRVLRSLRRARLPSPPELPEGSDGLLGEQRSDRPHAAALQLRLLRLARPREQVSSPVLQRVHLPPEEEGDSSGEGATDLKQLPVSDLADRRL